MTTIRSRKVASNDRFNGIDLGDRARDTLTGFTGIVTGRVSYLTGCDQVLLLPRSSDETKINGAEWFDIERIQLVDKGAVTVTAAPSGMDLPLPSISARGV